MLLDNPIDIVLIWVVFVIAIGFHEYAHAYVSNIFWDPTPELQWRLTPNPIKHLDPIWFLLIFLIHFWWGKPVQVNPAYYKNPLRDELLVSLAWPFVNFLIAFFSSFLFVFFNKYGFANELINNFFQFLLLVNIWLWVFNLLPIYPLDGYRIVKFLKPSWWVFMEQNSFVFVIILFFLIFASWNLLWNIIIGIISPIYDLFISISNLFLSFF